MLYSKLDIFPQNKNIFPYIEKAVIIAPPTTLVVVKICPAWSKISPLVLSYIYIYKYIYKHTNRLIHTCINSHTLTQHAHTYLCVSNILAMTAMGILMYFPGKM